MKMRMWMYAGLAAASLMLAGCAGSPSDDNGGADDSGAQSAAERAISEARAAVEKADERDCLWEDTESILEDAEEAAEEGSYAEAEELANEARAQAEKGMEQCDKEERLTEEKEAERSDAGDKDEDRTSYEVERGDTLWGIAGMATHYDDPYQWPLIFKANRDRIEDADLIHPGQEFTIRHDYSKSEVEAAVEHARTRGEWSLGRTEESDTRYLRR